MSAAADKFWKRVTRCKHSRISEDYFASVYCDVCHEGRESHCLDCGVFIDECACGCAGGLSGWPIARHKIEARKKRAIAA